MKIVFISNFYNHHQAYISKKLYELTGGDYWFISTAELPEDRKKLGYSEDSEKYVIQYGVNNEKNIRLQALIDSADVVIIGSAPEHLLKNRKAQKKLIVRYSERPLKNGFQWWKYPIRWIKWHKNNPTGVPIYMLCASAYTASDYARFGLFKKRTFRWGYFPECKRYTNFESVLSNKNSKEILWCGRMLDWKHPDDAIAVAERLKNDNYDFQLLIIGKGKMEQELKRIVLQRGLSDVIKFLGSMSPGKVRAHMEHAGIYLFTSDRKEGWGAVLNEAMNSGCAVVASYEAGATPYLINKGINGLVYSSGNVNDIYIKVKYLFDHPEEQRRMGRAAYKTIVHEWNPEIAAERLLMILEKILEGHKFIDIFLDGPCSHP